MPYVECEVVRKKPGPRECTVAIRTLQGHREFLEVPESYVRPWQGKTYLAVALVGRDASRSVALVELPFEADSGANRVWVSVDSFLDPHEVLT
jgi:hypothetical protein